MRFLFLLIVLAFFSARHEATALPPAQASDTCFYELLVPPDIDVPATPHFDTTIVVDRLCDVQVLLLQGWGTSTSYSLLGEVSGKIYHRSASFSAGETGASRMMDITALPAGSYSMSLLACGNGGGFTLRLK